MRSLPRGQSRRWNRPPAPPQPTAARCCTGTTRWCRRSASTSPASRRSWTCSWCRSTPTKASRRGRPARWTSRRRRSRRSGCAWRRWQRRPARRGDRRGGHGAAATSATSAIVQARTAGFVERVYARAPGDVVAAGAPLVDVLVPEWLGAQQEYLAVQGHRRRGADAAARQRLLLLGMPAALIERGRAQRASRGSCMTITAPDRRRDQRADGAPGHVARAGHDAGAHQRPGHGVARSRGARGAGRDDRARAGR